MYICPCTLVAVLPPNVGVGVTPYQSNVSVSAKHFLSSFVHVASFILQRAVLGAVRQCIHCLPRLWLAVTCARAVPPFALTRTHCEYLRGGDADFALWQLLASLDFSD